MLFSHYQKACLVLFTERQLYSFQLDIVGHVTLIRLIHWNEIYDITLQQNLILEYAFFLWIVGAFLSFLRNNCECLLPEHFIPQDKIWNMNAKAIYIGYSEFWFQVRKVYGLVGLIFFKIIYTVHVILWSNSENTK